MEQNTSLKDKALNWWRFALTLEQSVDLIAKYKLKSLVLDSEILTIYLKEAEEKVTQPEIYNDNNPALFTVREMREVANDLACKVLLRNDGTANGFWDVCKSIPVVNKKFLSFTEAEVSKEEETVEQAADKYSTSKMGLGESTMKNCIKEKAFLDGAAWQKEQDRELISDLLNALKSENWDEKTKSAITKAEKNLNNQ